MMSHLGLKSWQCKLCGFSGAAKAKVIRHLETKHKSHDKANAISLPTKFQFNFDDFKVPHDANSQTNIVYEVIETVESTTDETGASRSYATFTLTKTNAKATSLIDGFLAVSFLVFFEQSLMVLP